MRKHQVDETREDYQRFQRQAYDCLPAVMDSYQRVELAEDIARQMCLHIDRGGTVNDAYLRQRCRYRAHEGGGERARLVSWESITEPGEYQVGDVLVQSVPVRQKQTIAPEAAHKAPQPMRRAKRTGSRGVGRLTAQERWVAFQQYLRRMRPHELQVMVEKANGVQRQETAHRLQRSAGNIANLGTRVKKHWQELVGQ